MKSFLFSIFTCFCLYTLPSCKEQKVNHNIKSKNTTIDNPLKVEDSAKTIIERANQKIKDSLKQ